MANSKPKDSYKATQVRKSLMLEKEVRAKYTDEDLSAMKFYELGKAGKVKEQAQHYKEHIRKYGLVGKIIDMVRGK